MYWELDANGTVVTEGIVVNEEYWVINMVISLHTPPITSTIRSLRRNKAIRFRPSAELGHDDDVMHD